MPDYDNDVLKTSYEDSSYDGIPIFSDDVKYEKKQLSRVICDLICDKSIEVLFYKTGFEFPGGFQNVTTLRLVERYLQAALISVENEMPGKVIVTDGFFREKDSYFFRAVRFYFINDNFTVSDKDLVQSIIEIAVELIFNQQCDKTDDYLVGPVDKTIMEKLLVVSDDFLRINSGRKIQNGLKLYAGHILKISPDSTFRKKQFKPDISMHPINALISDMHKKLDKTNFIARDKRNNPYKINFLSNDYFDELVMIFCKQTFIDFCLQKSSLGGNSKPTYSLCKINPGECEHCSLKADFNEDKPLRPLKSKQLTIPD